jgi:hypothetical protein
MFSTIISMALGAFFNRVRGGGLERFLVEKGWRTFIGGKMIHDIVFAAWFTILVGMGYEGFVDGFASYSIDFDLGAALILFGAMWLGRAPGWGVYVGGMIRKHVTGEKEIEQIDRLVLSETDHPVLRNAIALSLRGLMWTVSLSVGFLLLKLMWYSTIPVDGIILLSLSGALMGATYFIGIEFVERVLKRFRDEGWAFSEYLWGGLLWAIITLTIT